MWEEELGRKGGETVSEACGVFYSAVSKSVTIYFDVNHSQCKCVLHILGKLAMLVRSRTKPGVLSSHPR